MSGQAHVLVQGGLLRRQPRQYTSGGEGIYSHWVEARRSFVFGREKVSVDVAGSQEKLEQVSA